MLFPFHKAHQPPPALLKGKPQLCEHTVTCPVVRITHTDMYSFTNVSKGAEERRGEPHHEQLPSTCSIKQTGALFVCLLAFLTKHQQVKKQASGNCI